MPVDLSLQRYSSLSMMTSGDKRHRNHTCKELCLHTFSQLLEGKGERPKAVSFYPG